MLIELAGLWVHLVDDMRQLVIESVVIQKDVNMVTICLALGLPNVPIAVGHLVGPFLTILTDAAAHAPGRILDRERQSFPRNSCLTIVASFLLLGRRLGVHELAALLERGQRERQFLEPGQGALDSERDGRDRERFQKIGLVMLHLPGPLIA